MTNLDYKPRVIILNKKLLRQRATDKLPTHLAVDIILMAEGIQISSGG
jgi:hypothetical protein